MNDDYEYEEESPLDYGASSGGGPLMDEAVYIEVLVKQYLVLMQILASPELKPELQEGTLQMAKGLATRFVDRMAGRSYAGSGQYTTH